MKELLNYCVQAGAYKDSFGKCLVELEGTETIHDVIAKYIDVKRGRWEQHYSNPKLIDKYEKSFYTGEVKVYKGNLVLMDTKREYLD